MKKKMISLAVIARQLHLANKLLSSSISQGAKGAICSGIEELLMDCNLYKGFNNIYWLYGGHQAWNHAGNPEGEAKQKYIIGPDGYACRKDNTFIDMTQGEYARFYYIHKDLVGT